MSHKSFSDFINPPIQKKKEKIQKERKAERNYINCILSYHVNIASSRYSLSPSM